MLLILGLASLGVALKSKPRIGKLGVHDGGEKTLLHKSSRLEDVRLRSRSESKPDANEQEAGSNNRRTIFCRKSLEI